MHRTALPCTVTLFTLLMIAHQAWSAAPSSEGTVIAAETIAAARAESEANKTVDRLIRGVTVPDGKVAVAVLRRDKPETSALIHADVTETYLITKGSGTLVIGGTISATRPVDLTNLWAGASTSGEHKGGVAHEVKVNDVVVIPAGVAHRFSRLDGVIEYLVFRAESTR